MESEKKSRLRGENWTSEEKDLLLDIMRYSAAVIENKNTDSNTNNRKTLEWANIQNKLKERTGKPRDVEQLKGLWRRLKHQAKTNGVKPAGGEHRVLSISKDDQKVVILCPTNLDETNKFASIYSYDKADKSNDVVVKNEKHNNNIYDDHIEYDEEILPNVLEPVTEINYEEPKAQSQQFEFQPKREQCQSKRKMRRKYLRNTQFSRNRMILASDIQLNKLRKAMMKGEHALKMKLHRQELTHQQLRHKMELSILRLKRKKKELEIRVLEKSLE